MFFHNPAMTLLWGAAFTVMALAFGFAIRQPCDAPAPARTASARPEDAAAARMTRSETDNDEVWRRLM